MTIFTSIFRTYGTEKEKEQRNWCKYRLALEMQIYANATRYVNRLVLRIKVMVSLIINKLEIELYTLLQ